MAWIMLALLEKTALFRLAEKLPDDDTTDMARRQKIRRFISNSSSDSCYRGFALYWTMGKQIHVLADREFSFPKLAEWLWVTFRVGSTLRLKRIPQTQTTKVSEYSSCIQATDFSLRAVPSLKPAISS